VCGSDRNTSTRRMVHQNACACHTEESSGSLYQRSHVTQRLGFTDTRQALKVFTDSERFRSFFQADQKECVSPLVTHPVSMAHGEYDCCYCYMVQDLA